VVANFIVLTKLFVVQHRASVYLALKVRIMTPRFKVLKCVMLMTVFVFPFFPSVFPDLLISLCFSVTCTEFSNCIAVNHACKSNQDLANSLLMPYVLILVSVIPSSFPDNLVYLVLLSTEAS